MSFDIKALIDALDGLEGAMSSKDTPGELDMDGHKTAFTPDELNKKPKGLIIIKKESSPLNLDDDKDSDFSSDDDEDGDGNELKKLLKGLSD